MLLRWRRYFAVLTFLLLATPLAVGIIRPDGPAAFALGIQDTVCQIKL